MSTNGLGQWAAGAVGALLVCLMGLLDVSQRLANPSAPSPVARRMSTTPELRAATLRDPAEATPDEIDSFTESCRTKRRVRTDVGNGWQVYDADATDTACACIARTLSRSASRLEWLTYVYEEKSDSRSRAGVEGRIESLGMSTDERRRLMQDWRNRRGEVVRNCQRS